jgi:hypothetical protein
MAVEKEFFLAPSTGVASPGIGAVGIRFDSSFFGDGSTRGMVNTGPVLSHDLVAEAPNWIDRAVVPIGARLNFLLSNPGDIFFVGGSELAIDLGSLGVTKGAAGTATFTAPDASIHRAGDLIYALGPVDIENYDGTVTLSTGWICLGICTDVTGTTVTISGWPQSLADGDYHLYLSGWARFHQASVGDTHSNTTVDNVTNIAAWAIGNRIKGAGIPAGAYIANIVGTTITLSKAATATAAGVRLYDADVYSIAGTPV